MALLLAGAAIFVAAAIATSLLMVIPATALAETSGEFDAAGRARAWLAALVLPPAIGIIATIYAFQLYAEGTAASPHIAGLRPHLCLLPLVNAPAGAFALRLAAWLSLLLVAAAALRLLASATTSHLLRRMTVATGAPLEGASGNTLLADLDRPVSFTAGLLRPVTVVSTSLQGALAPAQLEAIVAHERAHARRLDNVRWLLAEVCATMLAPVPTAWYYRRRLREALEAAADDAAVASGVSPDALASALEVAGRVARARPTSPSLMALLTPMPALIDQRSDRLDEASAELIAGGGRPWRGALAAAAGVALVALLLLAARGTVADTLYCIIAELAALLG